MTIINSLDLFLSLYITEEEDISAPLPMVVGIATKLVFQLSIENLVSFTSKNGNS